MSAKSIPPGIELELSLATNAHGAPLADHVAESIRRLYRNPSQSSWEEAYGWIVCRERSITLWQAVCAVDPDFQTARPIGELWRSVPDRSTVRDALVWATR